MIVVDALSYHYPNTTNPAATDLSFALTNGEIFGLLGPSGAGKSTTQKVLIGLLKGYRGSVNVLGRERRDWGADYFEQVGVGFELPNHYQKLTGLENLSYFRSLYRGPTEDPQALLEALALQDAAHIPVAKYSKGMQMRLSFARALLNKPRLLFLDEPTSGLDPVNAQTIKALIRERQQAGTTIFLTTHNMTVADELCDRVAFIVDGEIRLIDAPKTLKERYGERTVRVEYGPNGHSQTRDFPLENLAHQRAFLNLLQTEPIRAIHTQEATLEQIFIQTTGRGLA